ncbi:MAG: hypothetical protein HY904_16080 [Deltaproteobacteria bacterium]|nr:hypothetical protein [Deltaproteobacteria bacterium]
MTGFLKWAPWCLVATCACGPVGPGGTSSSSSSSSSSGSAGITFTFGEAEPVGPDDPSTAGGLAVAVHPTSGEVNVLYFVQLTSTQTCTTNLNTQQIPESDLRLARGNAANGFTQSSVDHPRSADGVAATFDAAGNLVVVYTGGMNGSGICSASDLVQAVLSGTGAPAITTLAPDGNTGATCRSIQNACNRGDVVGRFPRVAFLSDGTRVVSTQDTHYGFSEQSDRRGADLEVMVGGAMETVDESSGAGYGGWLFLADGLPAVVHSHIADQTFTSGPTQKGVWLARRDAAGVWTSVLVDGTVVTEDPLSAAWHPQKGYALAWQDPVGNDLVIATSADGTAWTNEVVDSLGRVGAYPSLAFSHDTLVVAYYVCNGPTDTGGNCVPAKDGVRFAWKAEDGWHFKMIYNNEEALGGTDVKVALDGAGNPVVAFKSQGTRRVMVVTGSGS